MTRRGQQKGCVLLVAYVGCLRTTAGSHAVRGICLESRRTLMLDIYV